MSGATLLNWRIALLLLLSLNIMKLNVANPATGAQKLFDFEDERQTYVEFRYWKEARIGAGHTRSKRMRRAQTEGRGPHLKDYMLIV